MAITVNANGNTTAKGADTFTYDQPNRLKTATVAGTTETYIYDGDGTRFSRQVGGGTPIRSVSDLNRSLPATIDDGSRKYVYALALAYAVAGSNIEVYHTDRLSSVRAITDASGAVSGSYRTDEWGVQTASTGTSSQPFHFTGEPQDGTGLVNLRARYLDPGLGRFLSRDAFPGTAASPTTTNRFIYAGDNPTTRRDPSGHCWWLIGQGAELGFAAGWVEPAGGQLVGAAGGGVAGFGLCLGIIAGGILFGKGIIDQKQGQTIPQIMPPRAVIKPLPGPPPQEPPGQDPLGPGSGRGPSWLFKIGGGLAITSVITALFQGINYLGEPAIDDLERDRVNPSKSSELRPQLTPQ